MVVHCTRRTHLSLSILFVALLLPVAKSQRLTFDPCRDNSECAKPRTCVNQDTDQVCTTGTLSLNCVCRPPILITCLSDDQCPTGERCVTVSRNGDAAIPAWICVSAQFAEINANTVPVRQPNPTSGSLTYDFCSFNDDCLAPRICVRSDDETDLPEPCAGSINTDCFCVPPVFIACKNDEDCPTGERCGFDGVDICVSEKAPLDSKSSFPNPTGVADPDIVENILKGTPLPTRIPGTTPGPSTEPDVVVVTREVCVAEKHLVGVNGIYETGRHARVLCDCYGSCATPGHVIVYQGRGMMMRSYCDVVGCREQVMKVNSPKWSRGLRVGSSTEGLEFTAFAARYETSAEEVILSGMVRAGL